jgi:hypothetical protein
MIENSNQEESNVEDQNRSEQLNPNNEKFWKARGFVKRPENWEEIIAQELPTSPQSKSEQRVGTNKKSKKNGKR